jgi:hypothetical protein
MAKKTTFLALTLLAVLAGSAPLATQDTVSTHLSQAASAYQSGDHIGALDALWAA